MDVGCQRPGRDHLPLHRSDRRAYGAEHAVPERRAAAKESDDCAGRRAVCARRIERSIACAHSALCTTARHPENRGARCCTVAAPAPVAPTPPATTSTSTLPPPPLFECTAHDNGRYFTEDREPATRCLPMQTTNLAGGPATGGGSACEVVTDRCAPVPDQSLCEAWRKRAEQAEATWRFSDEAQSAERKQRYDQMRRVLDESRCANPSTTP